MAYYSYKMVRDYGFAPNPFHGFCTLANCKPTIRKGAQINDWIIGTGSKGMGYINRLIYIMQVSEKITFQEYWENEKFQRKKPILNGSRAQLHGDNIYHKLDNGLYISDNLTI